MIEIRDKNSNKVQKSTDVRAKLGRVIDTREPSLVRFICTLWATQRKDITYQEIEQAIKTGEVSEEWMERWRSDYSNFIATRLAPAWIVAIEAASNDLSSALGTRYEPHYEAMIDWTSKHSGELLSQLTDSQRDAIKALVQRATLIEGQTHTELAFAIRPTIGLYPAQAVANFNYYQKIYSTLIENGMNPNKASNQANDAALRYAGKQHRYRAQMIARTEMAAAYNQSEQSGVAQAIADGFMSPNTIKQWTSARDGQVCDVCRELHGIEVPWNVEFPGGYSTPPAHPHCRCAVKYISK